MTDHPPLGVTIWMNMPSHYQDDLFQALEGSADVDLRVVFARPLDPGRSGLGWVRTPARYAHAFLRPGTRLWEAACRAISERHRLHIVNGVWAEPSFAVALLVLTLVGARYAIYCEAPEPAARRSASRLLTRRMFGAVVVRGAVGGLAVSRYAVQFLHRLGLSMDRIYPFGYFQREPAGPFVDTPSNADGIEILYVGQLIVRKGLDVLLAAIEPLFLEYPELRLTIIGSGPERESLEQRHGSDRVRFEPPVSSSLIAARIALSNALVLPSRWDGWGVVVNEALSVGTPVIVSDACGAAELVAHGRNGYVVAAGDVYALRCCLTDLLRRRPEWPSFRAAARRAGASLSTECVGPYLVDCLRHMAHGGQRPVPPWQPEDGASAA
jgi:glycosyltransferase involved in cell wall biosynthesis